MTNTEPFFWETEAYLETFRKISSLLEVLYKLVIGSVNGLSTIFWVIEYWYKAQECKTWSANTKPLCWQSNVKLEVSKKVSLHIRVFYWKSRKAWIFWAIKYLYKAKKQQIWSTNAKAFFWKGEANLETSKQRCPYIEDSYKLVLKSVKSLNWIFWAIQY